ncbi:MAG: hypothetical protein OHK0012_03090 [Synechococcales cyanobacterium]
MTANLQTEDYQVVSDPDSGTVTLSGSLRLAGAEEYLPISEILDATALAHPQSVLIDVRGLQFLNSSGINMLSKFVLKMRDMPGTAISIQGSAEVPWQNRSLKNLQRLLPSLTLVIR